MLVRKIMKRTRAQHARHEFHPFVFRGSRPPPTRPTWKLHLWRILAVGALALVAYSNAFRSGLTLDNALAIHQDPRVDALTSQTGVSQRNDR